MGQLLSAIREKNKDDKRNDQLRNFVQLLGVDNNRRLEAISKNETNRTDILHSNQGEARRIHGTI